MKAQNTALWITTGLIAGAACAYLLRNNRGRTQENTQATPHRNENGQSKLRHALHKSKEMLGGNLQEAI